MDLASIWFWIVAFLFVGYFVLDGFDFGVGMSLPFLGKDDTDRRVLINTIGPVWDLNETWVIVAGASPVRGVPRVVRDAVHAGSTCRCCSSCSRSSCAASRSSTAHQRPESRWKRRFDGMIIVGSAVPALLWGVAFANIVQGVPLDADHNYIGTLFDLLNPYALLGGLTTLLLFFTHGVVFVSLKTDGDIRERARASRRGRRRHDRGRGGLPRLDGPASRHAAGSGCSPRSPPSRSSAGGSPTARRRGHGVHAPRHRPSRRRARAVRGAVPRRHALVERPGEQPHRRERVEHAVHAHGHELGGARLPAARARLPGLDVLGVPQARDARSHRGAAH